ncbi:MAG: nucleotidyltransferase family protein [Bacteroidales bacterium]|nr:nucleotidyltransferase family protein [Bacteroidales bacterium]
MLLRYSIGTSHRFPEGLSEEDWRSIYKIAQQQSLLGVLFDGIQQNPAIRLERKLLLKWYAACERIQQGNRKTNQAAVELTRFLKEKGLRGCILKGQGNTLNFPNPYSRMSGDIDVWVMPGEKEDGREKEDVFVRRMIGYARRRNPSAKACYHHVDAGMFKGIEVEIHYRPSFLNNLIYNSRLQRWFEENAEEQFANEVELPDGAGRICVPTHRFNVVYQLVHMYNHLIHEGIGLRQLVDYYFLRTTDDGQQTADNRSVLDTLRHLGLYRFAGAVMWVLKEKLGLEEDCLIVPPDERLGKVLFDEIMQGGNFGQHDERVKHDASPWQKNIQRLKRDLCLLCYFPSECLWEPIFRWYHFFWRMRNR